MYLYSASPRFPSFPPSVPLSADVLTCSCTHAHAQTPNLGLQPDFMIDTWQFLATGSGKADTYLFSGTARTHAHEGSI